MAVQPPCTGNTLKFSSALLGPQLGYVWEPRGRVNHDLAQKEDVYKSDVRIVRVNHERPASYIRAQRGWFKSHLRVI